MKKRRKKWLLPLFSLCLATVVILTMPGMQVHADAWQYGIIVAGTIVTSDNADNILAGTDNDGKVQYDPDTNTLTLNGANIEYASTAWYSPLYITQDLTIRLIGQNVIRDSTTGRRSDSTYTIRVRETKNLTICGDGSLELGGSAEGEYRKELYAILCEGDFTMQSGTLTATTENCLIDLYAIWCQGDFRMQGGTLTAITGKCTSTSKTTDRNNQAIVAGGNIYITGGELNAVSGEANALGLSSAIFTTHDIVISDAKVNAVSSAGLNSYAMNANEDLTIRNSEVACSGGDAGDYSVGLRCESEADSNVIGALTISGSTITAGSGDAGRKSIAILSNELQADNCNIRAEGGNATGNVYGIYTNQKALLNNCEVNTGAGTAVGNYSLGLWCSELEVNGNDSHITAKGGTAAAESHGISAAGFTLHGGSVHTEGGAASDRSTGLWTNSANISAGTLVTIAGQAGSTNAITSSPIFADNYKVTVKAGANEENAAVIEAPTDDTYQSNTYVSIEPYVHVHNWSNDWTSDATHHWHVCMADDCNITEQAQMDAYAKHTWSAWEVTTIPTAVKEGEATHTCATDGCSETETLALPAVNGGVSDVWTVKYTAPTMTTTGAIVYENTEYDKVMVTVPELSDASVWTKDETKSEAATTDKGGKDVYTSVYGEVEVTYPALGHTHTLTYVAEEPATESTEGIREHWHCADCGKDFADEGGMTEISNSADLIIPASGHPHTYSTEWTSDETNHWHAATCGHDAKSEEAAHTWNDGEITKQPTADETGVKTFTCTVCDKSKTDVIPATGQGGNTGNSGNTGGGDGSDDAEHSPADNPTPIQYVVRKGDTLRNIAKRSGVSYPQILAWNPQIKNPNLIFPGQVIIVGYTEGGLKAAGTPVSNEAVYDVVQKGDSLYRIAARNGVSLNSVLLLNPELVKQKYIYYGQKVRVK